MPLFLPQGTPRWTDCVPSVADTPGWGERGVGRDVEFSWDQFALSTTVFEFVLISEAESTSTVLQWLTRQRDEPALMMQYRNRYKRCYREDHFRHPTLSGSFGGMTQSKEVRLMLT